MGFFSWKTSDTKKSISNRYSVKKALPVYLITPENEKIYEPNYEGYGVFGGNDVFVLLARWNVPDLCTGDDSKDRLVGLDLRFKTPEKIKYDLKFSETDDVKYEDLDVAENCEFQGYFYC